MSEERALLAKVTHLAYRMYLVHEDESFIRRRSALLEVRVKVNTGFMIDIYNLYK